MQYQKDPSKKIPICTQCGSPAIKTKRVTTTRGSILIEIVLWMCFFVPGLIYSLWRLSTRTKRTVCCVCGGDQFVPADSPVGRKLYSEHLEENISRHS